MELQSTGREHGDVLSAISDGLVGLLKDFYGRGPTRAKSYYQDDLVVCVLRGGFTRVEETLLNGGRGDAVIEQRMEFQELMRERFEAVIEDATGRQVIGFMSGNQHDPDLMCEVFVWRHRPTRRLTLVIGCLTAEGSMVRSAQAPVHHLTSDFD